MHHHIFVLIKHLKYFDITNHNLHNASSYICPNKILKYFDITNHCLHKASKNFLYIKFMEFEPAQRTLSLCISGCAKHTGDVFWLLHQLNIFTRVPIQKYYSSHSGNYMIFINGCPPDWSSRHNNSRSQRRSSCCPQTTAEDEVCAPRGHTGDRTNCGLREKIDSSVQKINK